MIIRRKHTANFTVIGNDLFDDLRLTPDEVCLMGFLLSRPNDWEIRRPALMRRWKMGRDRLKKAIRNLVKCGWIRVERLRIEGSGLFHFTYEIHDQPGPELTEDEVRRAFAPESGAAGEDASADTHDLDAEQEAEPCASPPTCSPSPVSRPPVRRRPPIEESTNTDSPRPESTQGPPAVFDDLHRQWPASDILSPLVCETQFASLSAENRRASVDAAGPYIAQCRARNRKLCDLATYLREKRFLGGMAKPVVSTVPVLGGTPQAQRWLEYRRANGEKTGFMEDLWKHGKPWHAQSEWPPPRGSMQSPI